MRLFKRRKVTCPPPRPPLPGEPPLPSNSGRTGIRRAKSSSPLVKFQENPIIRPEEGNAWESKATFNPGAFSDGERVYLLYRAIGDDDVSVLGFAASDNGVDIEERGLNPAYSADASADRTLVPLQNYVSGGGWNGGCEDPRLTLLDNKVYMLYTAFDGWGSVRIALTSISFDDFRKQHWKKWKKPVFISPPDEIHKNWVIFPEKIKGKYAVLHSISPEILIEYLDSLNDLEDGDYIQSRHVRIVNKDRWDSEMRGAGPAPIKTKYGWLLLYHATDHRDPGRYKLGALLLDLDDPAKILYRSSSPILEPDEFYENCGFKAGVVYSCGAAVMNGTLFVYYGASDSFTCVATARMDELLDNLRGGTTSKLTLMRKVKME